MSWGWPATPDWSSAPVACWARPTACRSTAAAPSTSSGRRCYAAQSWSHRRRVIIKAEVVRLPGRDPKCNPRFVVTNLREAPATGYAIYCQRGDMENRLKELHDGLALDRTSCSRFWANQFRVLLTAAAYVLLQALRQQAHGTACARAQVSHAAGAAAQTGRVGRALGAPHRVAPTPHGPLGHDLAPGGRGRRRGTRLTAHPGSYRTVAQRDQTGDVCRESPAQVHATTTLSALNVESKASAAIRDRDRGTGVAG